jgi:uncharacterized protein YacL
MYSLLSHAHSGLRWILLGFLVLTIIFALTKWIGKKPFWETHKKFALFTMIFAHVQLILGLILYFISPKVIFSAAAMKDATARFFLVEHSVMMLLSIILITVGYSVAKRQAAEKSSKTIFILFTLALVVLFLGIPWPSKGLGTGWY